MRGEKHEGSLGRALLPSGCSGMHVEHHSSSRTGDDPCQPLLLPKVPTPAAPTVLENLSGASHPSTSAEIKENLRELGEKGKNELCKHTPCSWVVFQEIQRPLEAAGRALVGCWIPSTAAPFIQVPLGYTRAPHLGMCSGETHSQQTKKTPLFCSAPGPTPAPTPRTHPLIPINTAPHHFTSTLVKGSARKEFQLSWSYFLHAVCGVHGILCPSCSLS